MYSIVEAVVALTIILLLHAAFVDSTSLALHQIAETGSSGITQSDYPTPRLGDLRAFGARTCAQPLVCNFDFRIAGVSYNWSIFHVTQSS